MITHDFSRPIPPGTVRISVITDGETYVTDFAAAALAETLRAFQDFAGLDAGSTSCKAVAADARENGDAYMICVAALWLFLRMSDEQQAGSGAMNRDRINAIVRTGGSAMLAVNTETRSGEWDFRLHQLPSRPAMVRPYRAVDRDRRGWR
jgi:hypothetical protein